MSGVSGAALREVSCINRSLSALADVLGALAEQRPHVPYRNSKLTHLLQDAIGDALSLAHTHTHKLISACRRVARTLVNRKAEVKEVVLFILLAPFNIFSTRWRR